jgi:hypothetical protein
MMDGGSQGRAHDGRRGAVHGEAALMVVLLAASALAPGACGSAGGSMPEDCDNLGEEFFAGISKTSAADVTMEIVSAEPAPPANSDKNAWTVRLTDTSTEAAAPIEGANLIVAPYMPQHGHGAPNIPATEEGGGSYTLSPIYLKMTGLWEVTLKATPAGGPESRVMFRFCIPPR